MCDNIGRMLHSGMVIRVYGVDCSMVCFHSALVFQCNLPLHVETWRHLVSIFNFEDYRKCLALNIHQDLSGFPTSSYWG